MNGLRKTYHWLFLIGWFFFPFNDFEGVKEFGEFKNEAGAFFFMGGFIVLLTYSFLNKKIAIPYRSGIFQVLLIFLGWCIICTLLNADTVSENYFKHTTGLYRFLRQYFSLLISALIFVFYFWNVIKDMTLVELLQTIRKVLLIGLIFVFVYGFLETLIVYFNFFAVRPILDLFDYFPFLNVNFPPGERISSVAYESPSLGNYLITVSGWMFSYIFTEKNKQRFIPTLMVLFLTFFSGSRTALINITLQLAILFFVLYSMNQYKKSVINFFKYGAIVVVIMLALNGNKIINAFDKKIETLNFADNLTKNVSNQSRFGMQYASLQVFKDNPIIGVGFGQETYHKRHHYPGWAKRNNWEFKVFYENKNYRSFPTAYNLYTRLLAETGIIGVSILIYLIYLCISRSRFLLNYGNDTERTFGLILLISFAGLSLNWFQTDFFRQYGFWLCLVILIKILRDRKVQTTSESLSA